MSEIILCSICARGGSKGVKNKNLKLINGKPLIAYSIEQALKAKIFNTIAVSSDSDEILDCAKKNGANIIIKRPIELATDQAPKLPVIRHAFLESEREYGKNFDYVVDLDATSPLRDIGDIRGCVEMMKTKKYSNVITGSASRRSPYFNLVEINDKGFVELSKKNKSEIIRRQDAPKCFDLNASIYVWSRDSLLNCSKVIDAKTGLFEMPEERSWDIDSELDFKFVEFLLKNNS